MKIFATGRSSGRPRASPVRPTVSEQGQAWSPLTLTMELTENKLIHERETRTRESALPIRNVSLPIRHQRMPPPLASCRKLCNYTTARCINDQKIAPGEMTPSGPTATFSGTIQPVARDWPASGLWPSRVHVGLMINSASQSQ